MLARLVLATAALLSTTVFGYPSPNKESRALGLGRYIAPGASDSRGPCPALNTLANHGLLPRDGRNFSPAQVIDAFATGFGISEDGINTALTNFAVVCSYLNNGTECEDSQGNPIFFNLTLLGEPHAFEHDHSFSRPDYYDGSGNGQPADVDNIYFSKSEFQDTFNVINRRVGGKGTVGFTADYDNFQEMHLQRQAEKRSNDYPGGFQQNIAVQLFEVGFIFGAMANRSSSGVFDYSSGFPEVRVDWWSFWFEEESFPTALGWVPAAPSQFNLSFISSVSSAVLAEPVTSTPSSLYHSATNTAFYTAPNVLPLVDPSPVLPLFPGTPYAAPTPPSDISKRTAAPAPSPALLTPRSAIPLPSAISEALALVKPAPTQYNLYEQEINVAQLAAQISADQSYLRAVDLAISSLL